MGSQRGGKQDSGCPVNGRSILVSIVGLIFRFSVQARLPGRFLVCHFFFLLASKSKTISSFFNNPCFSRAILSR